MGKTPQNKIKKKSQELERMQKQLTRLTTVRPAFMDEYEKHEAELSSLYAQYLERFRNLDYLEHELDSLNRAEQEKMEQNERALKRMQKRLREEEWRLLRGEEGDDDALDNKLCGKKKQKKGGGAAVMYSGSMDAPDESSDEDTDLSDDILSDSEPPISLGNSSDEDILEETSDDSLDMQ